MSPETSLAGPLPGVRQPGGARHPGAHHHPGTHYPMDLVDSLRLADGRAVVLRPVLPRDAIAEGEFIGALSPLSRRLRFHGAVNRLPDAVLEAMTHIDHREHVALIAQALDSRQRPRIVADARYVADMHDDGHPALSAEFAVAVADDWQGVGLGRTLLQRLAQHARRQGLQRLHGAVLLDNQAMLGLMQRLGARLAVDPDDGSALRVTLAL